MDRRSFVHGLGLAGMSALMSSTPLLAQNYPKGPIKLLVGYPAGSGTDAYARLLVEGLRPHLGEIIIDNRPGAAGITAASALTRATPDGQTLLFSSVIGLTATAPAMSPVPFDSVKDFAPISKTGSYDPILVVNPDFPAKTLEEFIKLVRAEPGKHKYAVSGLGNLQHLTGELFAREAGLSLTAVPYTGGSQAITDVLSGRMPILMTAMSTVGPLVEAGKLRLIASGGEKRLAGYPEVTTFKEGGYPNVVGTISTAVFAPAGTPRTIIDKVNRAIVTVVADPAFRTRWEAVGGETETSSPDELAAEIPREIKKWRPVMERAGLVGK